jgi:hypothetical protein
MPTLERESNESKLHYLLISKVFWAMVYRHFYDILLGHFPLAVVYRNKDYTNITCL